MKRLFLCCCLLAAVPGVCVGDQPNLLLAQLERIIADARNTTGARQANDVAMTFRPARTVAQ